MLLANRFPLYLTTTLPSKLMRPPATCIKSCANNFSTRQSQALPSPPISVPTTLTRRWRPMCLYYTHGKCTKMDDPGHVDMFNHDCSLGLEMNDGGVKKLKAQDFDYFLVIDLEGKVEILEFPVIMIDARTGGYVDFFHRFVRPVKMGEKRVDQYIEGKYGKIGVDRNSLSTNGGKVAYIMPIPGPALAGGFCTGVWHDTAIPFTEVLQEFEVWMTGNRLWERKSGGSLRQAAFVTCGNWDLKTKIPQQCIDSCIELPPYFNEWINLKDIYLNFYNRMAPGMRPMMNGLGITLLGSHHLGFDDSKNIARVMQHMLSDGALMQITAKRSSGADGKVEFVFKNRIW